MTWQRAVLAAILVHLALPVLFTLTLRGTPDAYKMDFVFMGSILRPQEVLPRQFVWTVPVDVRTARLTPEPGNRPRIWGSGIQVEKPDLFQNTSPPGDGHILRFIGQRVKLDGQDAVLPAEDDIPAAEPLKMRQERP